ncbi:hypothetical protein LX32DRAFT_656786 [Colletotrichum zoysiae]|uniref:Uncharacterized protein n=1 Tax=Colletotrichum zoysiae TaxID=1216348 RepID=A0AAD9H952_9PEZI|nr:hypothetical protein LX32DRAFT_656786 [Colletotrichum zoysiae]
MSSDEMLEQQDEPSTTMPERSTLSECACPSSSVGRLLTWTCMLPFLHRSNWEYATRAGVNGERYIHSMVPPSGLTRAGGVFRKQMARKSKLGQSKERVFLMAWSQELDESLPRTVQYTTSSVGYVPLRAPQGDVEAGVELELKLEGNCASHQ